MRLLWTVVCDPAAEAILLIRFQCLLWDMGLKPLAKLTRKLNVKRNGIDVSPGVSIGPGLVVRHPVGVVIGCAVRIGADCTILQGVTIGERLGGRAASYPTLEDQVTVGAGASILGDCLIGNNAVVGAGAVVTINVPASATVAGVPGRIVKSDPGTHE